jgi:hypothetical protein
MHDVTMTRKRKEQTILILRIFPGRYSIHTQDTYTQLIHTQNMHTQNTYTRDTHTQYIHTQITYIYVFFTYSRYTCQKNTIPRVYIPHLCLLDMYKSYIPRGMYKISRIGTSRSLGTMHLDHTMGYLDHATWSGLYYRVWPVNTCIFGNTCMPVAWDGRFFCLNTSYFVALFGELYIIIYQNFHVCNDLVYWPLFLATRYVLISWRNLRYVAAHLFLNWKTEEWIVHHQLTFNPMN